MSPNLVTLFAPNLVTLLSPIFPPQQTWKGIACSMGDLHSTHFFMMEAQLSQATMCRQGLNSIEAAASEQTRQSST